MQVVHVGPNGAFKTITEALSHTSYEEALTIQLEEGLYYEKIACYKRKVRLIGKGMDKTKILWDDAAYNPHEDGKPYGTFRSHTAFFDGDVLAVQDLTIENAAGVGKSVGQAVAAAVYTTYVSMHNVRLLAYQDTLFLGPLPDKERVVDGFLGPRQHDPRVQSYQIYENCEIQGDVDFIFGGGNGIFTHCTLHGRGTRKGYLSAPSTKSGELGFYFEHCQIGAEEKGKLYLGRPWRSHGRSIFAHCQLTDGVNEVGFDPWQETEPTYLFAEYPTPGEKRRYHTTLSPEAIAETERVVQQIKATIKHNINEE